MSLQYPFPSRTITAGLGTYGARRHPITGRRSFHKGVDFDVHGGAKVHPAGPGRIVDRRYTPVGGHTVTIEHEDGARTKYLHLRHSCPLEVGTDVTRESVIGVVGSSGSGAMGEHLCMEVWVDGSHVDPGTVLS